MTPAKRSLSSSYAISLIVHIVVLLILALLSYKPLIVLHWHQFEWSGLPEESHTSEISHTIESGGDQSESLAAPKKGNSAATLNPEVQSQSSTLIESPVISESDKTGKEASGSQMGEYTGVLTGLGDLPEGGRPGSGYNASLVSGAAEAYIIRQSPPKINPQMDDEILIDFRLSESGKVVMNSVEVQSYKVAAHWDAVRKEMPNWRFGFKGAYKPERIYRIRVVFRVK